MHELLSFDLGVNPVQIIGNSREHPRKVARVITASEGRYSRLYPRVPHFTHEWAARVTLEKHNDGFYSKILHW